MLVVHQLFFNIQKKHYRIRIFGRLELLDGQQLIALLLIAWNTFCLMAAMPAKRKSKATETAKLKGRLELANNPIRPTMQTRKTNDSVKSFRTSLRTATTQTVMINNIS